MNLAHIASRHCSATSLTLASMLALAMAISGCSKKPPLPSAPPPASSQAADSTSADAGPTGAPSQPQIQPSIPSASADAELTQIQILNRAVLGWTMKNHRRPQSFEEFAGTANMQIPDPPAGQKYTLNAKGFVVLVNSTP